MTKAALHFCTDPVLGEIVGRVKLSRLTRKGDVFEALLRSIIFQQLSTKAASTIHQRFATLFPDEGPTAEQVLELEPAALQAVGLSGQKCRYVRNVSSFWQANELATTRWSTMSDDEVLELLTQIVGVGQWTVQMLLMFTLRRPDVFPIGDLGIQNAMIKHYRLRVRGKKLQPRMEKISKAWQPHRTLACRYLWASLD